MSKALYTRKTFYSQPTEFRIGAIVSDGMWYSLPKWRKLARCEEHELHEWIEEHMAKGDLLQSATGAKSYRFTLDAIHRWYNERDISLGDQLIDFLFPPRIWDNQTENDGFLAAPLRTVSIVSFTADAETAKVVTEGLRGVARVREVSPGKYKAYGLEASHINASINEALRENPHMTVKTYTRSEALRRELVDFTPEFAKHLVLFYRQFGHTLVKPMMDTIRIFIPDPEDQESQITIWVLTAIEKFDESSSVPFSGYLNSVLRRWPYDLPAMYLGKELSSFQRVRSRALKKLAEEADGKTIPNTEIAEALGLELYEFLDLEEKHRAWVRSQTATTLTWDENADEKAVESNLSGDLTGVSGETDISLANKLSIAVVEAAIETNDFDTAYFMISQIDTSELDLGSVRTLPREFVTALASHLSWEQ